MTGFWLHVFSISLYFLKKKWNDFSLHLDVIPEDINRIDENVALLSRIFLSKEDLDSLTFSQIFLYCELSDFLCWLEYD